MCNVSPIRTSPVPSPRGRHEFAERTGHALSLCMEVTHGGFETVVTEHDLEIADKGAVLERMGGKGMAQVIRFRG